MDGQGLTVPEIPYVAEAVRCYGCQEIEAELNDLRKVGGDLDGVSVRLRPFDPTTDDVEG